MDNILKQHFKNLKFFRQRFNSIVSHPVLVESLIRFSKSSTIFGPCEIKSLHLLWLIFKHGWMLRECLLCYKRPLQIGVLLRKHKCISITCILSENHLWSPKRLSDHFGGFLRLMDVTHRLCFNTGNSDQMNILTEVDQMLYGHVESGAL